MFVQAGAELPKCTTIDESCWTAGAGEPYQERRLWYRANGATLLALSYDPALSPTLPDAKRSLWWGIFPQICLDAEGGILATMRVLNHLGKSQFESSRGQLAVADTVVVPNLWELCKHECARASESAFRVKDWLDGSGGVTE